jgi:hypothetical protein
VGAELVLQKITARHPSVFIRKDLIRKNAAWKAAFYGSGLEKRE